VAEDNDAYINEEVKALREGESTGTYDPSCLLSFEEQMQVQLDGTDEVIWL
jgi:hypothetical protein